MSGRKAAQELRDALVLPAHGAGIRIATNGLWSRFKTRDLLKPGADTGFQEGDSGLCGVRPAWAAGSRQGTRPLDPDYRLRAGLVR